jgi:hypothetical protein
MCGRLGITGVGRWLAKADRSHQDDTRCEIRLRYGRDASHVITSSLHFRDDSEISDAGTARRKWTTARA